MNVFDLQATIKLDTGDYDSKLSSAEGKASGFASKLGSGLGTVGKVAGAAMAAAGAAIVGFGASSVSTGMQFDSAMSQVAATMGTTVDQIGNLRDFAQEMGSTTVFSATQSAEALNYMALAGYDAETSMQMLPNVLNLAASGGMELATASDMVTDAQSALGLSIEETTTMVDQMAKTASTTNTSVEQLGSAFLTVGGTARNLKGGTAELSQALGILADNGIKGAEGGTKLRNMILSLSAPTEKAAGVLDQLGVSAFDADGEMRPLQDTFMDLNAAMADMTTEEKTQALNTIFNKADLKAVNALLGTNADRWDEVAEKIGDCEGAAQAMADTQLDNLEGDITLFKSALEGAQIAISDKLTPTLREFVQFGSDGLSELTTAFKEEGLSGAMDAFGTLLSDLLSRIVGMLPSLVDAAGQLVIALTTGILQNLPQMANAAIQIITTLATGLAQALPVLLPAAAQAVVGIVEGLIQNLPLLINSAVQLITGLAQGLIAAIPILLEAAPQLIGELVAQLIANAPLLISCALQLIMALASGLIAAIPELIAAIPQLLMAIVNTFLEYDWATLGQNILEGLKGGLEAAVDTVVSAATSVAQAVIDAFKSLFGIASPSTVMNEQGLMLVEGLIQGIKNMPARVAEVFSQVLQTVLQWFSNIIQTGIQKATEFVTNIISRASQLPSQLLSAISPAIQNVIQWGSQIVSNATAKIVETANNVVSHAKQIPSQFLGAINPAIQNVISWGSQLVSNARAKVSEMGQQMIAAASGIPSQFMSIGRNIISSLISGIGSKIGSLYSSIHSALSGLVGRAYAALGIGSPSKVFKQIGKWTSEGLKIGWEDDFPKTQKKIEKDLENISGVAVATPTATVVANAKKAVTALTKSLKKANESSSSTDISKAKNTVNSLFKSMKIKDEDISGSAVAGALEDIQEEVLPSMEELVTKISNEFTSFIARNTEQTQGIMSRQQESNAILKSIDSHLVSTSSNMASAIKSNAKPSIGSVNININGGKDDAEKIANKVNAMIMKQYQIKRAYA